MVRTVGLATGASGMVPVARDGGTRGMHVHVEVASEEEGVAVLHRIAPWLPMPTWRAEAPRAAHWRASRYALSDDLVPPVVRAAYERTGSLEGVVDDLVARTEASWEAPEPHSRS
jgi:hypothetical protein